MYEIENDGIDHINIYSKGKTKLGKLLSNFAYTPFTGNGLLFNSVEGWYYWYITGKKHDYLTKLFGYNAKLEGRKYERLYTITEDILLKVYISKVEQNKNIKEMILCNNLPYTHYYIFGNKKVETDNEWMGILWNEVKEYILSKEGSFNE